jgi:hypothetical protein
MADDGQKWPSVASFENPTLRELLGTLLSLSEHEREIVLKNSLALARAFAGRCGPS